jgi:hypothetical protein
MGAAVADAAGKRSCSSASTGDLKGEFPGSATKEMVLSVAIADLFHSNAICESAANTPKFKRFSLWLKLPAQRKNFRAESKWVARCLTR